MRSPRETKLRSLSHGNYYNSLRHENDSSEKGGGSRRRHPRQKVSTSSSGTSATTGRKRYRSIDYKMLRKINDKQIFKRHGSSVPDDKKEHQRSQNFEPTQAQILGVHIPVRYTLALFGLWPVQSICGIRIPSYVSLAWSLLQVSVYVVCICFDIRWWANGRPTITGATVWEGRVSEILYVVKMLSCWTAVFFLTRKEGPVILAMLCDQRLYMRHRQAIAMIYVLMAVYLSYTIALYYQIFQANFENSGLHAHHYFNVTAEFLFNLPFAASVVVFSLVCLHVRDQVNDFACGIPWIDNDQDVVVVDDDEGSRSDSNGEVVESYGVGAPFIEDPFAMIPVSHERHTIGQLSEHFDFVCEKLRVPQRFFGPFLHLTHICTIVRLGVILFWNFDEHRVMEGVWLQNVLLTVRVVAMCLLEDFIGSQVVTSTQKIQQRIVKWERQKSSPDSDQDAITLIREEMRDSFKHIMLQQRSSVLESLNYHSLAIFGIALSPENLQTFTYFIVLSFVVTIAPFESR